MVSENPTDKQSQPNDTQAKSSEKASAPQQLSSPSKIATKSDTPPTPHGYQITCKKEKDGWDRVKFWAEMLGLLVLVAYTTFAALQWCEMKKAVKAAQGANQIASDNLTISQRPWLGVDGIPTIVVPLKVNKLTEDQAKLDSSVAVSVKNFGNSPALGVGVHFNAMVTLRAVENNLLTTWPHLRHKPTLHASWLNLLHVRCSPGTKKVEGISSPITPPDLKLPALTRDRTKDLPIFSNSRLHRLRGSIPKKDSPHALLLR